MGASSLAARLPCLGLKFVMVTKSILESTVLAIDLYVNNTPKPHGLPTGYLASIFVTYYTYFLLLHLYWTVTSVVFCIIIRTESSDAVDPAASLSLLREVKVPVSRLLRRWLLVSVREVVALREPDLEYADAWWPGAGKVLCQVISLTPVRSMMTFLLVPLLLTTAGLMASRR